MTETISFEAFEEAWFKEKGIALNEKASDNKIKRFMLGLFADLHEYDLDDVSTHAVFLDTSDSQATCEKQFLYVHEELLEDEQDLNTAQLSAEKATTWFLVLTRTDFQYSSSAIEEQFNHILKYLAQPNTQDPASPEKQVLSALTAFITENERKEQDRFCLLILTRRIETDSTLNRKLQNLDEIGRRAFGRHFDSKIYALESAFHESLLYRTASSTRVEIAANLLTTDTPNQSLLAGAIRLHDFYQFLKNYAEKKSGNLETIFEKNIRRFLSFRGKINKGIKATLLESPKDFGLYNNGITIVVKDWEISSSNRYQLYDPYIVNGCQTTMAIYSTLSDLEKQYQYDPKVYQNAVVLIKIAKVLENENLIDNITQNTNSQNTVKVQDFISLNGDLKYIKNQMLEKHDIFLELQKGDIAWFLARNKKFDPSHVARIFDLLKIYGAGWLGYCGTAFSNNRTFSPGGKVFNQIINQVDGFNTDDLYICFLFYIKITAFKKELGSLKYIFCFLVIKLFKSILVKLNTDPTRTIDSTYYEKPRFITSNLFTLVDKAPHLFDDLCDHAKTIITAYLDPNNNWALQKEPLLSARLSANDFIKKDKLFNGTEEINLSKLITLYQQELNTGHHGQLSLGARISQVLKTVPITPLIKNAVLTYLYTLPQDKQDHLEVEQLLAWAEQYKENNYKALTWILLAKKIGIPEGRSSAKLMLSRWVNENKFHWLDPKNF